MRSARDVMQDLVASGLNHEQLALVMELAMVAAASAPKDEQAERRRAFSASRAPAADRVWVYVIAVDHPDDELIKVGISQHPGLRLKTLERERGYNLFLAHTEGPYGRADAVAIEREAHLALAEQRETGEWFFCGAKRAIEVVSSCAKGAA